MGLRITGGSLRGRVLRGAVGPGVRPTADRVREALFSALGQDLTGCGFLDAFGGSGIVGLEAASRGATVTTFEQDRRQAAAIRAAARAVGVDLDLRVGDAVRLAAGGRWDLVFADPPYAREPGPILAALGSVADVLVYEADASREAPREAGPLALLRVRAYGDTALWFFRAPD